MPFDHGVKLRVDTRVPLWGILTVLAALGLQAIALYYGLQRQVEEQARQGQRQTDMAADIKSIANQMNAGALKTMELTFSVATIEQRLRALESKSQTPSQREHR